MTLQTELGINFLLGGTIIASVSYLASFVSPLIAAIVWSYPFSILPTIYFMKQQSKPNDQITKFLFGTSCVLILLLITTLLTAYLLKHDTVIVSIMKATCIWAVCSLLFYTGVYYSDTLHYFV
jgi:uncharacterized protein YacL